MDINIGTTVSYAVSKVKINNLIVFLNMQKTDIMLIAPYTWIDENDSVIRQGTHIYKEAMLRAALGQAYQPLVGAIKQLITSDKHFNLNLATFDGLLEGTEIINSKPVWVTERVTQEQVNTAFTSNGLSLEAIQGMIASMAQAIFA